MSQPFSQTLKTSATVKVMIIGLLTIVLSIPLFVIFLLGVEREYRFEEAQQEVSQKWGNPQTLVGPILTVPYTKRVNTESGFTNNTYKATFLPDELKIKTDIKPEIRSRGIFDIVLYDSKIEIESRYQGIDTSKYSSGEQFLWNEAELSIGMSDLRGIDEKISYSWNEANGEFEPGKGLTIDLEKGIHSNIKLSQTERTKEQVFKTTLNIKGSRNLTFSPVGKENKLSMNSSWKDPSFMGEFLPTNHEISDDGFTADWDVSYFARSYPQSWSTEDPSQNNYLYPLQYSSFGTELLMPVDFYQKNSRSTKYGVLFILLTFAAFFLFEILNKMRIHPLNYLFVGSAMVVFYLLLLSLSEHLGFGTAYLLASISTTVLVGSYSSSLLKDKKRTALMTALIAAIYGFLYIILQLQDYALLMGSLTVFALLALLMQLTKNIDWYQVQVGKNSNHHES